MLTVKKKDLTDDTNLGAFTLKSSQFKTVLKNLATCEKDYTNKGNLFLLLHSILDWKAKKNKEFEARDVKSNGLVRRLCVEVGIDDLRPPPAHTIKFVGNSRVVVESESTLYNPEKPHPNEQIGGGLATPVITRLDKRISVLLQEMQSGIGGKPALLIVDLYGDDLRGQGLEMVCEGKKISDHIDELLQASEGIPVIICAKGSTYGFERDPKTGAQLPGGTYSAGHNKENALIKRFREKIAGDIVHFAFSKTNCVLVESGIIQKLNELRVSDVFVIGFNANMCVAATIFGSAFGTDAGKKYYPGLLDFGFNVITSRYVVGSGSAPLKGDEGWPYMGPHNNI
jgi:nicotinamidase-related amidase